MGSFTDGIQSGWALHFAPFRTFSRESNTNEQTT
jgi:hypothetical protein